MSPSDAAGVVPWPQNPRAGIPASTPARLVECPNCGLAQTGPECRRRETTFCCRCGTPIVRRVGKSLNATLACTIALLLLFLPAVGDAFLTTVAFGASRTSKLPMSVSFLWREGWPLLSAVVCLVILVFPTIRFMGLASVLTAIRAGKRPPWLGITFRLTNALQTWATLDVFLLGFVVAYARLRTSINVTIDVGAYCFIATALLSLFVRASLDKALVWELITPQPPMGAGKFTMTCLSCGWVLPRADPCRCPRCKDLVSFRRTHSLSRTAALVFAAALCYLPANLYPIATIPIQLTPTPYTVIGGVLDLAKSHLLGLALLVFCASFAIPLLKMAGLGWCVVSTLRRSTQHLVEKTRVYRLIEEIGRWSMVDPLTIACFVPVLHFNGLIDGRAEPAATQFAAVVILTTFAAQLFDPRLMWDAAERPA
jgi:paraquat-inducible protein A